MADMTNRFKGKEGALLRGNKVYNGGGTSPNPSGRNQHNPRFNQLAKKYKNKRKIY